MSLVSSDLETASQAGPLVVVAHSMGGNIVYDILTHFRTDLHVELLVTVGSQVGLFEELGLFPASDPTLPTAETPRVPAVSSIHRWINVIDPADVLAYSAEPIFEGAVDIRYKSDAVWAHSAYFRQPHFHDWLATQAQSAVA